MKNIAHYSKTARVLAHYIFAEKKFDLDTLHINAGIEWLLTAHQAAQFRGFSHSFHLFRGWMHPYPETTGYLLPTLFKASAHNPDTRITKAIVSAYNWLLEIQNEDGSFNDLNDTKQVFDTGQILIGMNYLYKKRFINNTDHMSRIASWLIDQQELDGSFEKYSFNKIPHAYYSRVGASLLEAGLLLQVDKFVSSGLNNLQWTLSLQECNGWFRKMSFSSSPPLSHTIIYTLEGLLYAYSLTGDRRFLNSVLLCARSINNSTLSSGGIIRSRYNSNFMPLSKNICITGMCQWALLCLKLQSLGFDEFSTSGNYNLDCAKKLQVFSSFPTIHGALSGSYPIYGDYMRFSYPNWGIKFFLDALLFRTDHA